MKTFVFSTYGGSGKTVLAKALADKAGKKYVSIDPQDGGRSDNACENVIIDCPPYIEVLEPILNDYDHVIYPFSLMGVDRFGDQILLLKDVFEKLLNDRPNLKISFIFSDVKNKWSAQALKELESINSDNVQVCKTHLRIKRNDGLVTLGDLNLLNEISL